MDIYTLALSIAYSNKIGKQIKDQAFKTQIELNRDILNNTGKENIFYFLPKEVGKPQNGYDEYIYFNNKWELMGGTDINLSNYYTKTEIDNIISSIETLQFEIAQQRPLKDIKTNTIYLIPSNNSKNENIYDEYIYINDSWELIGNTTTDLSGYAPLNSPQLTGVPYAPTATYGTNTDQIATTAFVQQSLRPTVIISVNDIPVETMVSVTLTLMNSEIEYSVTDTLDSSGLISFLLDWTGEYSVQFNNPQIKGHDIINVPIPRVYTYNADWTESITYTILIDTANSNTETACTYADGAIGMTKASSLWDKQPIFKQIKPCVFQNGQVNYYLNPNDWTKKRDSDEDSILTGEDGDVMIEFPKFAYKIKTENGVITVSISNDETVVENDSDYTYDAFSRLEEGDLNFFYKGAFKGSLDEEGRLRSIVGTKPANNKNINAFRTAAQANGDHYQQSTYAQLKALQCLYLIKYGDRNGQTAVGKGVVGASASYVSGYNTSNLEDIETATNTLTSGMSFGTTANNMTHMRLFGIEDFWGCIYEWVDGLTTDGDRNIITSWNSFSNEGVEPTTVSTPSGLASNTNGWNKSVVGNTAAGFMPIEFRGSSSTYWADSGRLYASCVLSFGGGWNDGDVAGPFRLNADVGASYASASVGARLSYV